jgi:hypothetical protein
MAAWNSGAAREDQKRICSAYPPSFCMHPKDPHAYWEMIKGLENRFRVGKSSLYTIFGSSWAAGSMSAEK